jgi:hypothetical protein
MFDLGNMVLHPASEAKTVEETEEKAGVMAVCPGKS